MLLCIIMTINHAYLQYFPYVEPPSFIKSEKVCPMGLYYKNGVTSFSVNINSRSMSKGMLHYLESDVEQGVRNFLCIGSDSRSFSLCKATLSLWQLLISAVIVKITIDDS